MRLIITDSIFENEFRPFIGIFPLHCIKEAAKKGLQGLGIEIKNSKKIKNTKLKKLNLTGYGGAGRVVFLVIVANEDAILTVLRHKNDKKIGENITIENSHFKKLLNRNLDLIISDLEKNTYKSYEL